MSFICGYWQVELDEPSSPLCTFHTPCGGYRYTQLPFGIKTARDIFIEEMSNILKDLPGVDVVADDTLVYGGDLKEHNEWLESELKSNKLK